MQIQKPFEEYMIKNAQNGGKKVKKPTKKETEVINKKNDDNDNIVYDDIIDTSISTLEKADVYFSNNMIKIDTVFKLIDLFFKQKNIMYTHLYNSFDKLLDEEIPNFLNNSPNIFYEHATKDKIYRYKFKYNNIAIKPPFIDMDDEIMFPQHARLRNLTYGSKLVATITQIQEITDIATDTITRKIVGQPEYEYPITNIPILLRSKYCSLNLKKGYDKSECEFDPGGYFIVNGSEKVVMSLERMIDNRPLVFIKKDSTSLTYTVQVNSKSHRTDLMQIINIRIKKDNNMTIRVPILNEIPVFILVRALGIESDSDIINYCVYDNNDTDMINIVRMSLENSKPEKSDKKILTQSDAINYLITKMRVMKKYNETDKDIRQQEKRLHLLQLLKENFLPHVEGGHVEKAFYLGYMINRLLQCFLGRIKPDDRDSYVNKRVDLPGQLLFELFKQFYKKMLNECNKFFKKRNPDDENPLNIINQIKPNIIEQGLKTALLTGAWGKKKGVAQMLQRLTYLQTLSSLRRINSPTVDASTNKLTSPRHLHASQVGPLCLSWDTEILLSDGVTVKRIGEMKNSDTVLTVNKTDLTTEPSRIHSKFVKIPEKMLKITTISGRVIKCTDDHPLLVKTGKGKYEMKAADKLTEEDCLVIKHTQKYLEIDKDNKFMIKAESVSEQYKLELLKLGLLDRNFTQNEMEIMARLLGANITDGHIDIKGNYYDSDFALGEENDVYELVDDIMKLGFSAPSVNRQTTHYKDISRGKDVEYKTYAVQKNGVFAYFLSLLGAFSGKKTEQIRKLPEWILNANNGVIREFLSGFIGGDGSKLAAQKNKYGGHRVTMSSISQTTIKKYLNETIEYVKSISKLLTRFKINTRVSHKPANYDDDKIHVCLDFETTNENLTKFIDIVGFRYCNEKRRNSALPIEYIKSKSHIINTKIKQYNDLIEYFKANDSTKLKEKIAELGINRRTAGKVIRRYQNTGDIIPPKSYKFEEYNMFASKYREKNDFVTIKIESIEEIPVEPVYDFTTVSGNHSFIGNGVGMSNCFVETSEGAKVGLVKNLSMIGSVTVVRNSQIDILKEKLLDKVKNVQDIKITDLRKYTRVLLNEEIIGLTETPRKLYNQLKQMKYEGTIDPLTGIAHDIRSEIECKDLRINCDTGRIYHAAIRVKDNEILLTPGMVDLISIDDKESATKITSWNQFMMKFPGVIEYLDSDEQYNSLLSMFPSDVEEMKIKMNDSIDQLSTLKEIDYKNIVNRYDQFSFVRYTHCEIHPSLLIGVVVANIPFCESNQGPRNIYQYSQARQAMGVYATNWRDRLDISYILYHPQRPIVTTRSMKYIGTEKMPSGENCIVAIACYTGLIVAHVIAKTMASLFNKRRC